jgi:hypothetical protein
MDGGGVGVRVRMMLPLLEVLLMLQLVLLLLVKVLLSRQVPGCVRRMIDGRRGPWSGAGSGGGSRRVVRLVRGCVLKGPIRRVVGLVVAVMVCSG